AQGRPVRYPGAPGVAGAVDGLSSPRAVAHLGGGDGRAAEDPQGGGVVRRTGVRAVEGPVDTEGGGEAGGALGEFLVVACREPPGPGELHALDDLPGAQQDPARTVLGAADQVHAEPHAVREVDVDVPGRAEHDGVAGVGAVVGLDLGQAEGDRTVRCAVYEGAAEEVRGDLEDGSVEELPGQGRTVGGRDHAVRGYWRRSVPRGGHRAPLLSG